MKEGWLLSGPFHGAPGIEASTCLSHILQRGYLLSWLAWLQNCGCNCCDNQAAVAGPKKDQQWICPTTWRIQTRIRLQPYLLQSIGVCWGCDVWCVYLVRWPFKELHTHNRSLLTKAMVQYWTSTLLQIKLGIHLKTDLMKKSHRTENLNTDCCRIKWTLNLVLRMPPYLIHCVLRVRCRPAMWPSSQDFPHDLLIANQKYI